MIRITLQVYYMSRIFMREIIRKPWHREKAHKRVAYRYSNREFSTKLLETFKKYRFFLSFKNFCIKISIKIGRFAKS